MTKPSDETARNAMTTLALLCGVAILGSGGCKKEQKQAAPPPEVTVATVTARSIPVILDFSGTLKAVKEIEVIPRVSGYIEKRYFDEGAFVTEGDPLYLIDPKPFKAALRAAKAQLAKSRASAKFLNVRAKRYSELAEQQMASREQMDEAVSQASEMRAQISLDQANVDAAKLNLGYTSIAAPFAGRTQQTRINEGELVTAQKTVLTELVQIDPVYTIFSVSRSQMFQIQEHNPTGIASKELSQFEVTITLPNGKPYDKKGQLDFLSAQIDPSTDMVQARAVFPNTIDDTDNMVLIPGQYVPVQWMAGQQADALLVPVSVVHETQAGRHVLVVNAQDEVVQQDVDVDRTYQGQYVVKKGLKSGDRVIVEGAQRVRPKMKVKPVTSASKRDGGVPDAGTAPIKDASPPG